MRRSGLWVTDMGGTTHNRRSALGILATGPVAMLPALAVMQCSAKAEAASTSPIIAERISAYRTIDRQYWHFVETVHDPAMAALMKAQAAVPHYETSRQLWCDDQLRPLRTDDDAMVRFARRFIANPRSWRQADPEYWDAMAELVTLADKRRDDVNALDGGRAEQLRQRDDELCNKVCEAVSAVTEAPVRSVADLSAKVAFLDETENWNEEYRARIVADIHLLAGRA